MNIGLIIAGGVGQRMKMNVPKQFIKVLGKPIMIYTLEAFERNKNIDEVVVVCLKGWEEKLQKWCEEYGIKKLKHIVPGGSTGMESLRNGMYALKEHYPEDSIIVIHDAVRPLISDAIIDTNIEGVKEFGTAITCVPTTEALLYSEDMISSEKIVDRNLIARTQTPQSLYLSKFIWAHEEAISRGIKDTVATCTLLVDLGESVHIVWGEETNFKVTTAEHIALMEAYIKVGAIGG
ncbi:MAG: 2-C-methyl-D-erythritol 4-phosphate cytidylyltransferase [Clostridia bacterium]|nr:2-C-methyl-D-erythritol 4-phosphate cytidylyltransferase [Clostridia bacterium]